MIKLSSPYSSRLLSGRHVIVPYIFEIHRGERARNSTGRVPATARPPSPRGIIGLRSVLSQLSHRRKRTSRLIIPKPFLYHTDSPYHHPPPLHPAPSPSPFSVRGRCARLERGREGGWEGGGTGGCRRGNSREGTQNVEGTEGRGRVALLSYRNGVARSQPFNELGQLTLYAQSFPAFRFYVNFNSLPSNRAAKECGESVRPRIRRIGPSLSTTTE